MFRVSRPGWIALVATMPLGGGGAAGQDSGVSGHALGDPSAPVEVVEFADFACSACAEFAVETWPRVRRELVDSGRVYWRVVPFSLGFRHGERAARAAECAADQGRFWEMHDRLFAEQERWMRPRRPENTFQEMARSLGLEAADFRNCLDQNHSRNRVEAAGDVARESAVRGTPTFMVNGEPVLGALPFPTFLAAIEKAAARSGRGVS
jgi:protein-disulfide isomerase